MAFRPTSISRTATRRLVLGGLALGGLVLGACGDDDDSEAAAADSTTTATVAETTTTAAPTPETTTTVPPAPETTTTAPAPATTAPPATAPPATSPPPPPAPAKAAVTVQQFSFKPTPVTVKVGTILTWTNKDNIEHTVTSGTSDMTTGVPDGKFDGSMPAAGKSFTFTFATAGTYPYYCARHASMIGQVVVN